MDLSFSQEDRDFQQDVQSFLETAWPQEMRDKKARSALGKLSKDDLVGWQKRLAEKGWAAVNWPAEHGGAAFTPTQSYIWDLERAKVGAPGVIPFGMSMVAPVIMKFGTDEQKAKFLPPILNSDVWFCQGYSEPGSGSDLASLKTKAEDMGDHYLVNGVKTWTTLAQHADWMFCLVRTSNEDIRQMGISFILMDMKTPGIEVKPIITIDGDHEVNSVFFTDVKVPVENLVGEEGKGWTYAKFLLAHERFGIAAVGASMRALNGLKEVVSKLDNSDLDKKVAEVEIAISALEMTELRLLSELENGGHPGAESSILKIKGTEIQQGLTEIYVEAAGEYALMYPGAGGYGSNDKPSGPEHAAVSLERFLNFRKTSIYGGSNEIQKNIISKHVLGV